MPAVRSIFLLSAVAILGCGGNTKPKGEAVNVPALPAPARTGPAVEHRDYAAWKKFKPGTRVTRTATVTRKGTANRVVTAETFTLVAVGPQEARVERRKTVERFGEDAGVAESPPDERVFPATFALPDGFAADAFQKPDIQAKFAREETVAVLGREYKCRVFTFSNPTDGAGPMAVTVWWSDDLPGRVAQQTMTVAGSGTETREVITALTLAP